MMRHDIGGPWVFVGLCLLASCGSDSATSPSFAARGWSLQIGGASDAQPDETRGTPLDVGRSDVVRVVSSPTPRAGEWPLVVAGETRFSLPPPPQTPEDLQREGLRLVGVTYCAFVNEAGVPSEPDVLAVDRAVSSLVSALETPLLEASPNDEGVSDATGIAAEVLFQSVLEELGIPESEEQIADAEGNRGLWFIGELRSLLGSSSRFGRESSFDRSLSALVDLLPSLVWVHGDPSTRKTLTGCGTLMLLDAPYEVIRSELGFQFDRGCLESAEVCSLEAYERNRPQQILREPDMRQASFAGWGIEPTVEYNRLSCVGRPKAQTTSVPDGACLTSESLLMYANLEYTHDSGQTYCGAEAVAAIAQDCLIGAAPRCGVETGFVLSDGIAENRETLADCVNECTTNELQRLTGADDRSAECRSCYGEYTACVAASCAVECADGSSSCFCDSGCDERFVECAGPIWWPRSLPFF